MSFRPIPSAPCLALIHAFEQGPDGSFAAKPYQDPAGFWTVGWGHKLSEAPPLLFLPWTEEQADQQALTDLETAATGVSNALGDLVNKLTEGQYAACIDLAFNIGVGAFAASTLCHYIKTGAMNLVPAEFMKWVHAGHEVLLGLVRRRQAEVDVWRT